MSAIDDKHHGPSLQFLLSSTINKDISMSMNETTVMYLLVYVYLSGAGPSYVGPHLVSPTLLDPSVNYRTLYTRSLRNIRSRQTGTRDSTV